ncbi:MAG: hypothetical protein A2Z72_05920 [Omnitrophica bacterium RBG_13_46_9]|nr:MAG: hypothetical protein A2Z72_05920 [Omnitrophica bacterium RBG_13_46_9]
MIIKILFLSGLVITNVYCETAEEYFRRGRGYLEKGDYQNGIHEINKGMKFDPGHGDFSVYYDLGVSYGFLGKYHLAITYLEKAAELNPNHADSYYNLGIAHLSLRQYEEASKNFQKAKEVFQGLGDTKNAQKAQEYLDGIPVLYGEVSTEPGDLTEIAVDKEVIRSFADDMCKKGYLDKAPTEAELDLFSENPDRVARLKEIADYSRDKAKDASRADANVPEDAYRHVLWSYLLTMEYGAQFSKKVTDAHETNDDTNTPAQHRMDFHNNAIGREYAEKGYKESDVLHYVMTDKHVMRYPR